MKVVAGKHYTCQEVVKSILAPLESKLAGLKLEASIKRETVQGSMNADVSAQRTG